MADLEIAPYVVHEELIEDHRLDGRRSGEGSVAVLSDGSLLMVYGRFSGPADHDRAELVERRSADGGLTWSAPLIFRRAPENALNVMSVSLLALNSGRLGCLFLLKESHDSCLPMFLAGSGLGRDWGSPAGVSDRPGYHVVNNDRLVELSGGRLMVPFCREGLCGCLISDDGGENWRRGRMEIRVEPENVRRPRYVEDGTERFLENVLSGRLAGQEPGLVELCDGRLLMWCRSNGGYAYRAFSADGGDTWTPFEAIPEFSMPNGPQSIRRLPGTGRLIMLYNDRGEVPFNYSQFGWRRPLAVAASDDEGASWRRLCLLEPETVPSNCYYSICFHRENVIFTYYEGVMKVGARGVFAPRNLASLKIKIIRRSCFEPPAAGK